jgi:hypothetical protein
MKYSQVLLFGLSFTIWSCQSDAPKEVVEEVIIETEVIEDTVMHRTYTADSNSEGDGQMVEKNTIQKSINKNMPSQSQLKAVKEKVESDAQAKSEPATAQDIDNELNTGINRKMNPDNYNGVNELKNESKVELIPIISDTDKSKFYVQFAEKPTKMSKSDLLKISSKLQKVYVINHLGVYKYCVGKFETEAEASAYKMKVPAEFGLKNTQVSTFADAW